MSYAPVPPRPAWVVPAPPGTPYHRMARTAAHRWWRPLVGTALIVVAGLMGVIVLGAAALAVQAGVTGEPPEEPAGNAVLGDPTADLALQLVIIAAFLPLVLLAAWTVQRRRPGTISSVAGRLRWRWLLTCAGPAVVAVALQLGLAYGLAAVFPPTEDEPGRWVGWSALVAPAIVILALVPLQAATEEYAFRGWLLQAVAACTLETSRSRIGRAASAAFRTPWPAIAAGAALFMLGHGYTGLGMLDVFLFGLVSGWLAVRTGGLEASVALHVVNNVVAFMIPASLGTLDGALDQGAVPWQGVVADVVALPVYAAIVLRLARRGALETVSPAGGPPMELRTPAG